MLVLSDTGWATRFMPAPHGEAIILQWFGSDSKVEELVNRLISRLPTLFLPFKMRDTTLQLLVGADEDEAQVVLMRPVE